ncbi:MAG: hypothetical protein IPH58_12875 [Sphingobacteriales bacterium]|nr:hypothetical protein [Sphingobacteriales bacterium]
MERDRLQYPGDDSRSGGSAIKGISDYKLKMRRCKAELCAESAENAAFEPFLPEKILNDERRSLSTK